MSKRKKILAGAFLGTWVISFLIYCIFGAEDRVRRRTQLEDVSRAERMSEYRAQFLTQMGSKFLNNEYPTEGELFVKRRKQNVHISYTLDPDLQEEAYKLLKSYRPDYGAIVVMDAITGKVLAMTSYQKGVEAPNNLALRGTYPAASIFKIVTATAALDKYKLSPDTLVMFNGSNHTLYKRNVMDTKVNRWTRGITLREAFARSINTVFGRLTFEKLQPQDIEEYAIRFGFNKQIVSDLPIDTGFTDVPTEKSYELAEIVSGFNRVTRMSPVQGAMIAASVATDGIMRVPYLIQNVKDESGGVIFEAEPVTAAVTMSGEGARRLRVLMEETIVKGTSRTSFRGLVRDRRFKELELGGKTGSIHGMNPKGKTDWFVGYAIGGENDKLAVAAVTVHVDKWTVKSSYLAQSLLKRHFKDQFQQHHAQFFKAAARDED